MTPKEKASDLISYFRSELDEVISYDEGKKCAIICVKEVLSVLFQHHEIDYYKAVKEELEKL